MTEELWKDIPEYEGYYQVSNLGNVKSLLDNKGRQRELILKLDTAAGYRQVALYKNGIMKRFKVHRLVVFAFYGMSSLQVNHINGNKTDNRLCNLEYVTQSENMKHAYLLGLEKPCDNGFKKAVAMVKDGVEKQYQSIREMCRENHFDRRTVMRILHGVPHYNSLKGYKFKYL